MNREMQEMLTNKKSVCKSIDLQTLLCLFKKEQKLTFPMSSPRQI